MTKFEEFRKGVFDDKGKYLLERTCWLWVRYVSSVNFMIRSIVNGENPIRVGIVGSRKYENRKKIKEFIFKLKTDKGADTIIVSGGCKTGVTDTLRNMVLSWDYNIKSFPHFTRLGTSIVRKINEIMENLTMLRTSLLVIR